MTEETFFLLHEYIRALHSWPHSNDIAGWLDVYEGTPLRTITTVLSYVDNYLISPFVHEWLTRIIWSRIKQSVICKFVPVACTFFVCGVNDHALLHFHGNV